MKLKRVILFLFLLIFLIPGLGLARNGELTNEQFKKLQVYRKGHKEATDKRDYLLKHLDDKDEVIIKYNIESIWQNAGGDKEPRFLRALEKWSSHKNPQISKRAEIVRERVEDRYQFNDFQKSLKGAKDKRVLLHSYAGSDSDWVKLALAKELADYDDPQSIAILESIAKSKRKLVWREYDEILINSPARRARKILENKKFKPILKRMRSADTPLSEKKMLVRKYAVSDPSTFRTGVYSLLMSEVETNPQFAVPLLTELYSHYFMNKKTIVVAYPDLVDDGLDKCLQSSDATQIAGCIELIGMFKKDNLLQDVFDVTFGEKGNLNYRVLDDTGPARYKAMFAFNYLRGLSVSQLEQILYSKSKYAVDKKESINILSNMNTKESMNVLEKFMNSNSPDLKLKVKSSVTLEEELENLLTNMGN